MTFLGHMNTMNRKNKLIVLQLAGFGDTLSLITRIPAMLEQHPDHQPVFYLGGFGKSPQFSKEQLEREGYEAHIIKNLIYHNQLPNIRDFLKKSVVGENDLFIDASFCEEIFQNKEPEFYKYEMKYPYEYRYHIDENKTFIENIKNSGRCVAVHPLTKSGNAEGFESDVEKGRFWDREQWKTLCLLLIENNYIPTFVGYGDEDWGLIEELTDEGCKIYDARTDVENTLQTLKLCVAGVFCNSWDWEVTSRIGIPTFTFYTKNHFFIQNHVPFDPKSDFWDNTYIETYNGNAFAQDVWRKLSYMIENKKRPKVDYSVAMITYNDKDCIEKTLQNIQPYINDEVIIVDGGSTDGTLDILKDFSKQNTGVKILHNPWNDNFEEQKNFALDQAKNKWRVWIDADETYEHIFWNQLSWYIRDAELKDIDCVQVPRINTLIDLNREELHQFCQNQGWNVNQFGWVNYPDYQQRIFNSKCKFVGRTHERIVGANLEESLVGVHCLHPKNKKRQIAGIEREQKQYRIEAEKVVKLLSEVIDSSKKTIMHHHNALSLGGTEGMCQIFMKYFEESKEYNHVLAYRAQGDRTRESYFSEILGPNKMIRYASIPELIHIISAINPAVIHHYASGIAEFPMVKPVKDMFPNIKFVQTAVFGDKNDQFKPDAIINVSRHVQHIKGDAGKENYYVIRNPVDDVFTDEDLREEFGIPKDALVFGRIGRSDAAIYTSINLDAYARVQTDDTYFISVNPSEAMLKDVRTLGIKNFIAMDRTTDKVRLSKFYNTIDVLAHARKDGECCPANVAEAFAHGVPVISHYGYPYNGHLENIQDAGFTVLPDDVDEYTRIMKKFIDKEVDYKTLSKNARYRYECDYNPKDRANQQLEVYKKVLNN